MTQKDVITIIGIFVIGFFAYCPLQAPAISPKTELSLDRIQNHMRTMAAKPHFMGTPENRNVKNYILKEFEKLGIEAEVIIGNTSDSRPGKIGMSRTENILAKIPGQNPGKGVFVCGHYDSVLNGPGAGDDIHAVACMLEVARLLKDVPHKNDINFLITDGEEAGLLGATAYTQDRDLSNIGVLLNFEARGNSGPSIPFEWSEGNAWLVRQLRKVGRRPIANSTSFEIYNRLPNGTDFTPFKNAGVPGINNGFIDGFTYYHNAEDTPENINLKTVMHTGDNMLRMTRHFANEDLTDVVSDNASFFNFFSPVIIYPGYWDLPMMIICLLLIGWVMTLCLKKKMVDKKKLLLAFFMLMASVIVTAIMAYGLGALIKSLYPHYFFFYAGQFYNHLWYLGFLTGCTLVFQWIIFSRSITKWGSEANRLSVLIFLGLVTLLLYLLAPTATYLTLFPALGFAISALCAAYMPGRKDLFLHPLCILAALVLPLAIWVPTVYMIYLSFSLSVLTAPALFITFIIIAFVFADPKLWHREYLFIPLMGTSIALICFGVAHIQSSPTAKRPLPSSLIYHYEADNDRAFWMTNDKKVNDGNSEFMKGGKMNDLFLPHPAKALSKLTDVQPNIAIPEILKDSLYTGRIKIINAESALFTRLYFENADNISRITINGKEAIPVPDTTHLLTLYMLGMARDTMTLEIERVDSTQVHDIRMSTRFFSLPVKDVIPVQFRRKDGYTAIVQEFALD